MTWRNKLQNSNPQEILKLYQQSNSLTICAQQLGYSIEALRKFMIQHNLPYVKQVKYTCDNEFFSRDNEKSFYWAGFLAADGGIEPQKPRITLSLSSKDIDHLYKYKKDLQFTGPVKSFVRKESRPQFKYTQYYGSNVRITCKKLIDDLANFNVIPQKSKIYTFPSHLLSNPNIKHFIRGLIDGDGSVECHGNTGKFFLCGTQSTVETTYNFLKQQLNLESGYVGNREDGLWIFCFRKLVDIQKIAQYLYDDHTISLNRKKEMAEAILLAKPRKIKINKQDLEDLIKLNFNIYQIANKLKVSSSLIRRRIDEFNIILPTEYKKYY